MSETLEMGYTIDGGMHIRLSEEGEILVRFAPRRLGYIPEIARMLTAYVDRVEATMDDHPVFTQADVALLRYALTSRTPTENDLAAAENLAKRIHRCIVSGGGPEPADSANR